MRDTEKFNVYFPVLPLKVDGKRHPLSPPPLHVRMPSFVSIAIKSKVKEGQSVSAVGGDTLNRSEGNTNTHTHKHTHTHTHIHSQRERETAGRERTTERQKLCPFWCLSRASHAYSVAGSSFEACFSFFILACFLFPM